MWDFVGQVASSDGLPWAIAVLLGYALWRRDRDHRTDTAKHQDQALTVLANNTEAIRGVERAVSKMLGVLEVMREAAS